ncbi:S15/NS1 RNA-binding domain-containing protein [Gyrodon lividus]|nr:S15/NS1 RNA-binding domain-containing protein [Gyrodon lividus]
MFRSFITQASRCIASSSRAELHTSAISRAKFQRPKKTVSKIQAKLDRKQGKDAARLYAVLGSEYNREDKWPGCDLQKTILTQDALHAADPEAQVLTFPEGSVKIPPHLNYGIGGDEGKKLLFEVLPTLTAENGATMFDENTVKETEEAMGAELQKANMFAKLVDLRNANARGLAYENRRRIIVTFSTSEQPHDTGRPEVQAALLTMQIRNLWSHLLEFRKDIHNRRALRRLVHQRGKVLRYLKRLDRDRYEAVLSRLGLDEGSVEGELVI